MTRSEALFNVVNHPVGAESWGEHRRVGLPKPGETPLLSVGHSFRYDHVVEADRELLGFVQFLREHEYVNSLRDRPSPDSCYIEIDADSEIVAAPACDGSPREHEFVPFRLEDGSFSHRIASSIGVASGQIERDEAKRDKGNGLFCFDNSIAKIYLKARAGDILPNDATSCMRFADDVSAWARAASALLAS
jgi:hypothetical protein